jgi:hypothetical protein
MNNLETLSADYILSIPLDRPEKLYKVKTEKEIKTIYRRLSMLWHPDRHPDSDTSNVFAHLKGLYETGLKKMEDGLWNKGKVIVFKDKSGKTYEMKYVSTHAFELGQCYIANSFVAWVFAQDYQDLAENAVRRIESLKFANNDMKKEMAKYLPEVHQIIRTDSSFIVVIKKDPGLVLLKDALAYLGNRIESRHAAWIISGMYHIACFLKYNHLMHGGITLDNYFINPQAHSAALLGGWWYAHEEKTMLKALSQQAVDVAPVSLINKKQADCRLDLEMIRLAGRQILGDASGVYLNKNRDIPAPMVNWLKDISATKASAFEEYETWQRKILKDSFGVRRFIEMKLTPNDIYQN